MCPQHEPWERKAKQTSSNLSHLTFQTKFLSSNYCLWFGEVIHSYQWALIREVSRAGLPTITSENRLHYAFAELLHPVPVYSYLLSAELFWDFRSGVWIIFPPPPLEARGIQRPDCPLEEVGQRPLAHSWGKSLTRISPPRYTNLCSRNPYFLT